MTIWQRDYSTIVIHKRFPNLMCSPFYDINFILQAKIDRFIKKKKINNSSRNISIAKENHHQMLPTSLLKYNKKLTKGLVRKFRNIFPNIKTLGRMKKSINYWVIPEALLNNKFKLSHDIYSDIKFFSFSLNCINYKDKNNLEVIAFNSNNEKITGNNTLNIIEEENWIQQTSFKIKSILMNVCAKTRSYSTTTLDVYYSENMFAMNEKISVSDIIFNNIILFGSKDCDSKTSFREKIQAFCAKQKKSLRKKVDKDDICKKRETSCITSERKCQKREKMCEKKKIDCSKREKRTCKEQKIISCEKKKSPCEKDVHDCHKIRKVKFQEDRCKQKKNDTSRTKDLCKKQHCMKQEQTSHKEKDPCKKEKKEEIKKPDYPEIKIITICEEKEKIDTFRTKKDLCTEQQVKQEQISKRQEIDLCKEKKKEEIEKSDCSKIKEFKPCEKKECPPVKKAPPCPENEKN